MPEKKRKVAWRFLYLLLIPLGILIKWLLGFAPALVENIYSQGIYKWIMQFVSRFTGIIPLSLWELSLIFLVLFVPIWLIVLIVRTIKRRTLKVFVPTLSNTAMIVSIWFIMQTLMWNINYERHPFSQLSGLEVRPSSVEELYDLCQELVVLTNDLRSQVIEDGDGIMMAPGGFGSIRNRTQKGYDIASDQYPFLKGHYGMAKNVLFSRLMSHTNIIGLYAVITGEANIDTDIPDYDIASTTMHEIAHQHGFAREDEANYIAWVTCMAHPDVDFKYSGAAMALIYSMNALYGESPDLYFELAKQYGQGLQRDLANSSAYWKQFQGPTKKVADKFNDTYLKFNGEIDGVKSYGRMVDLLLAENRKYDLKSALGQ